MTTEPSVPSGGAAHEPAEGDTSGGIPRAALERVLARATELHAASDRDAGEMLSEAQLLDIAREVGLDPAHMRQAMAEQRMQTLADPMGSGESDGPLLRSLGPAAVGAQRTVPGTPLTLLDTLDAYFPTGELLTRVRRIGGRSWWEPKQGAFDNLLRGLGVGGRRYDFVHCDLVAVTVTPIDGARCVLRFDTAWHRARRRARAQALGVVVALGLFVGAAALPVLVLGLVIPPFSYLVMALLSALGLGVSVWQWRLARRRYQRQVERVRTRLEALLDEVEQERLRPPPGVVERLLGR